jgi:hypothetical protein
VEQTLDEILEHHGIKGMRWGVRKMNNPQTIAVTSGGGQKIKTSGGSNLDAHPDAIRAAVAKQVAKKSSTDTLSTKDLQALVTRMNLEKQYAQLKPPSKGAAAVKFVTDVLVQVGKQQATKLAADQTAKLIAKALTR